MLINTRPAIELTVTFTQPEKVGSNQFEVLTSALASYQKTLLEQLQGNIDDELKPLLIQDAMTANELLSQLMTDGFNEVFDLNFYNA